MLWAPATSASPMHQAQHLSPLPLGEGKGEGLPQAYGKGTAPHPLQENAPEILYDAVTMGHVWVFGTLQRSARLVTLDLASYTLPDDVEDLVRILVGILE